jgi:hypothetical protein
MDTGPTDPTAVAKELVVLRSDIAEARRAADEMVLRQLREAVDALRSVVAGLGADCRAALDELRAEIGSLRAEMSAAIGDPTTDGRATSSLAAPATAFDVGGLRVEIGSLREEMVEVRNELGSLRRRISLRAGASRS